MLVNWPVGVGKSYAIDDLVEHVVRDTDSPFDLVLVLAPTHAVLDERRWQQEPPADILTRRLRARPASACESLDSTWRSYEKRGLGALGRSELCRTCPRYDICDWPGQMVDGMSDLQVIYATQAYLKLDPFFIDRIQAATDAQRMLTIVDEHGFVDCSFKQVITPAQIVMFREAIRSCVFDSVSLRNTSNDWTVYLTALEGASDADLRRNAWRAPFIPSQWSLQVQQEGQQAYAEQFHFIAYALRRFGRSLFESREKTPQGDVSFSNPPWLNADSFIFSATLDTGFAETRLGLGLKVPYRDHRFAHPESRWYNLASNLGADKHFPNNLPQILDFFAGLIAERLAEGKRPLLVSKKRHVAACIRGLDERLTDRGVDCRVVHLPSDDEIADPKVIPLIHYGVIGVNSYEQLDAVYCLNSYYVAADTVDAVLQDLVATDQQIPIQVSIKGEPRRRVAGAKHVKHRGYDADRLAPAALFQQEMDTVIQTIGRVRPYTKPREVILFQCDQIPGQPYDKEFSTLSEMREFFGVAGRRELQTQNMKQRVQEAQASGLSQRQAADQLGVARTTVQRHWVRE